MIRMIMVFTFSYIGVYFSLLLSLIYFLRPKKRTKKKKQRHR